MVERLRDHYKIKDEKVLEVMNRVPRHLFVPTAIKHQAYKDNALPIEGQQTISQPFIVAKMTELLELKPSTRKFWKSARVRVIKPSFYHRSRRGFLPSKEFRNFAKKRKPV